MIFFRVFSGNSKALYPCLRPTFIDVGGLTPPPFLSSKFKKKNKEKENLVMLQN